MPWKPGESGNPDGGTKRPFADALRRALARASDSSDYKDLNKIANALIDKAMNGDVPALKELADRLDGKVPQGIVGGDGGPLIVQVTGIDAAL